MKINHPVTQTERFLRADRPIVTQTDLKGIITYANESFIEISGFTRDQLIGHNHNVVRHPDMPPEAFADLWQTLKRGQPWQGLVKNRCANGDFYWVDAFVTPVTQDARCVGYMSVRTPPSREAVSAADALYRAIREQQRSFPATPAITQVAYLRWGPWAAAAVLSLLVVLAVALDGAAAWVAGLLCMTGLCGLAVWLRRQLLGQLEQIVEHLRTIDEGNLSQRIGCKTGLFSRIWLSLEQLRIHQRAFVSDVVVSVQAQEARAAALDEALSMLNQTSERQSSNLMQIAAALEEMSTAINEIEENNRLGLSSVEATQTRAQDGVKAMNAGIESSQHVVQVVSNAQTQISAVNETALRIGSVTQIISDIADQTNLLALNAAIEAARAGEQGRGFAVVADEVRKLAERTALSTREIHDAISSMVQKAADAVGTMSTVEQGVSNSTARIQDSAEALESIRAASEQASVLANGVSHMLTQQNVASHDVANNMEMLTETVDRTNASVRDIAEETKRLRAATAELRHLTEPYANNLK